MVHLDSDKKFAVIVRLISLYIICLLFLSLEFPLITDFQEFDYVPWSVLLCVYRAWGSLSFLHLNLQLSSNFEKFLLSLQIFFSATPSPTNPPPGSPITCMTDFLVLLTGHWNSCSFVVFLNLFFLCAPFWILPIATSSSTLIFSFAMSYLFLIAWSELFTSDVLFSSRNLIILKIIFHFSPQYANIFP